MRTMTVAEAIEWADDVLDRADAPGWYGTEYVTVPVDINVVEG